MSSSVRARTGMRLVDKHKDFLSLVKYHGEGRIIMNKMKMKEVNNVNTTISTNTSNHEIIEIIIDHKIKRNAISGRMMYDLAMIIDELNEFDTTPTTTPTPPTTTTTTTTTTTSVLDQSSTTSVCLILRGRGMKSFSAGADITLVKDIINDAYRGELMCNFMTDALNRLRQSCLISVCCINGSAIGGGAELITSCDFRIIVSNSISSRPNDISCYIQYVHAQIGACPGWGGIGRLLHILNNNRQKVIQLVGGSIKVDPSHALEIGLVDAIIDPFNVTTPPPTTTTTTTIDDGLSSDDDDDDHAYDQYCREACISFLQPYLSQKYPSSVMAIKQSIAAYEYLLPSDAEAVEKAMFKARWGNIDNKEAIHNKFPTTSIK